MFQIGIFSVIILAVSYWAVLWVMGRREDVLHGEFVEGKAQGSKATPAVAVEPSIRPVFPNPLRLPSGRLPRTRCDPRTAGSRPSVALPERPVHAPALEQPVFRPERMEQLLASIKQDLNQLVQK